MTALVLALLGWTGACSDSGGQATTTAAARVVPAEFRYDAGEGRVGDEVTLSVPQVDQGRPVTVRKVGRRTYERVDDAATTVFSLPPAGWELEMARRVIARTAGPAPATSGRTCSDELAAAVQTASERIGPLGDGLPAEDVAWALAAFAEPAVTEARLAHRDGTCDDVQGVVDLLARTSPDPDLAAALVGSSDLDVPVAFAGVVGLIPSLERAAQLTAESPS